MITNKGAPVKQKSLPDYSPAGSLFSIGFFRASALPVVMVPG